MRLLYAAALVSVVGLLVATTISYVHSQIDTLGDAYTSFCNVNSSINCDKVLSSPFAKIFGVPVAWLAGVAYAGMALLFVSAARARASFTALRLASLGVIGSLAFSLYMAFVSLFVIATICLLCTGLYAVALTLTALTVVANRRAAGVGKPPLAAGQAGLALAASLAAVALLAWGTWPASKGANLTVASAAEAQKADPDFYTWYSALPVVDLHSILRQDQAQHATAAEPGKVVIVDFFDLECGHCRHNHELLKDLQARHPDQVELLHRHFPLDASCNEVVPASVHPNACRAAEAAECAGLQGKLEEMIDVLFANQGQLFAENLPRLADKAGLDKEKFLACLDQHKTLPLVVEDCRSGARLDITSTPTVFFQGRRVKGTFDTPDKYDLAVAIDGDPSRPSQAVN